MKVWGDHYSKHDHLKPYAPCCYFIKGLKFFLVFFALCVFLCVVFFVFCSLVGCCPLCVSLTLVTIASLHTTTISLHIIVVVACFMYLFLLVIVVLFFMLLFLFLCVIIACVTSLFAFCKLKLGAFLGDIIIVVACFMYLFLLVIVVPFFMLLLFLSFVLL